jgi:hypothetical protein
MSHSVDVMAMWLGYLVLLSTGALLVVLAFTLLDGALTPPAKPPKSVANLPACFPNAYARHHPLDGHPTVRVLAESEDEALSAVAGGLL